MKKVIHKVEITEYTEEDELPEGVDQLLAEADRARNTSYSPYSKYPVGASMLMNDGSYVIGSNQENVSYPVGLCAERVALSNQAMQRPGGTIKSLGISVDSDDLAAPCGLCRQSLLEAELRQKSPIKVFLKGRKNVIWMISSIKELLPLHFSGEHLR